MQGKKSRADSFFSRVLDMFQERISQVVNLGSNKSKFGTFIKND